MKCREEKKKRYGWLFKGILLSTLIAMGSMALIEQMKLGSIGDIATSASFYQMAPITERITDRATLFITNSRTTLLKEELYEEEVKEAQITNKEEVVQEEMLPRVVNGIEELTKGLLIAQKNLEKQVVFKTQRISVRTLCDYLAVMPKGLENQVNYLNWYYFADSEEWVTEISFDITYKIWYEASKASKMPKYEDVITEIAKEVLDTAKSIIIIEGIDQLKTDYQKEKAIHDYIVTHTTYSSIESYDVRHPIYGVEGVLLKGSAVCQGYAETMKLFMDMLDIESVLVRGEGVRDNGTTEPHMWNLIRLNDGNWYHVDTTWNDPVPDVKDRIVYEYFNVDDEYIQKDHIIYAGQNLPEAIGGWYMSVEGK